MGCAMNKYAGHVDGARQVFRVYNVDDRGNERTAGKIEINEHSLVLIQKGKEPLHWPLRSLRRYGFDAELFSFESGRRCPTGPGIYAFKCHRAEALFNLLQEFIVRAGHEDQRQTNSTGGEGQGRSLVEIRPPGQHEGARHEYMNGDVVQGQQGQHEYVNTALASQSPVHYDHVVDSGAVSLGLHLHSSMPSRKDSNHVIQYAELDLPRTGEEAGEEGASGPLPTAFCASGAAVGPDEADAEEASHAMYINVPPANSQMPSLASLRTQHRSLSVDDPHSYTNLNLQSGAPSARLAGLSALQPPRVQYIQLDLKNSRENLSNSGPTPNSPISLHSNPDSPLQRKTDSYALIDFDRTQALQTRSVAEDDGVRKTRHNSNIDELN